MYSVVSEMLEVLSALFQGLCLQYFLSKFLESRFLRERWGGLLLAVSYGAVKVGLNQVLPHGYESTVIIGKQVLIFLFLVALTVCFYKAFHIITVFLLVAFMAVSEITFFLAYMILMTGQNLTDLWLTLFEKGYFSSADAFSQTVELSLTTLQFLMIVVYIALLCFFLRKIVESYREKEYVLNRKELVFIVTPALAGMLLCMLLRLIMITVEGDVPKLLYDRYPPLMWLVPAILLLSLLSILYGIKLFQDMIHLNQEKNNKIILENQISGMQEHMKEMERVYSGIRSMKHDMKNTLSVIMQLAAENNCLSNRERENTELQNYLSELNQTMDRLEFQFKTGNAVVDTLLNMKYYEAVRTIPDIQMDVEYLLFPGNLLIQSYDIGIILGNALDNAIEACRRLKEKEADAEAFIKVSSFQKGKMIFIEIENSFDGNVIRKRQSEFPVTGKTDREVHGIGLINVKNAAEKYHGAVEWSVNRKVFTLSIMLQNERKER